MAALSDMGGADLMHLSATELSVKLPSYHWVYVPTPTRDRIEALSNHAHLCSLDVLL